MSAKVLLADIETAPAQVLTFGLFNQNISLPQIVEPDRMMSVGHKWLDKGKSAKYLSEYYDGRIPMLQGIRDLLDEADIVGHYNGKRFDVPWIRAELEREGIEQPSPFKQVDLYRVAKQHMRFLSHKLDFLAFSLLKDSKVSHSGFKLWRDCLIGNDAEKAKAQAQMRTYCKKDVMLLEPLWHQLRKFFPGSVNLALYEPPDGEFRCQKCGSAEFIRRKGTAYTDQSAFPQWYCDPSRGGCGGWTRETKAEYRVKGSGVVL